LGCWQFARQHQAVERGFHIGAGDARSQLLQVDAGVVFRQVGRHVVVGFVECDRKPTAPLSSMSLGI
jgi:hypothetical protein